MRQYHRVGANPVADHGFRDGKPRAQPDVAHNQINRPVQHNLTRQQHRRLKRHDENHDKRRKDDHKLDRRASVVIAAHEPRDMGPKPHHCVSLNWPMVCAMAAKTSLISKPFTS